METLFLKLVNMSVAAGYLVLLAVLLRLVFRKAPKSIRLVFWALVGVRLVCPFFVESAMSLLPSAEAIPPTLGEGGAPIIHTGIAVLNSTVNPILKEISVGAGKNPFAGALFIASVIWLFGAAAMGASALVRARRLAKRVSTAVREADGAYVTGAVAAPFVRGLLHPRIYVPADMGTKERGFAIAHEQAHIRSFDHIIKPFAYLLLCVYWFNPLIWLAFALLNRDLELKCDERVVCKLGAEEKKSYAHALLTASLAGKASSPCPVAFGEIGVKARIKNILRYKKPALFVVLLAIGCCTVMAACFLTNPVGRETASPLPEDVPEVRYSVIVIGKDGDVTRMLSPLTGSEERLAENVIMNCLVKSAAWPGKSLSEIGGYVILRQEFPREGEVHDYYAFMVDGSPVLQMGEDGWYSSLDGELYEKLTALAAGTAATEHVRLGETSLDSKLEQAVTSAVMAYNDGSYHSGALAAEAHTTLKIVERPDMAVVYAVVLYQEMNVDESGITITGGSHVPVELTFDKTGDGEYALREYWEPVDRFGYKTTLYERFPADIASLALDSSEYALAHTKACYEQAVAFTGINTAPVIAKLIETVAAPDVWSNPGAYIEAHKEEYRELLYYGQYTLDYCFARFEKGGETGLSGHIMARACAELLGEPWTGETGQAWYHAYKAKLAQTVEVN